MIAYDALLGAGNNWTELCHRAMFHGGETSLMALDFQEASTHFSFLSTCEDVQGFISRWGSGPSVLLHRYHRLKAGHGTALGGPVSLGSENVIFGVAGVQGSSTL